MKMLQQVLEAAGDGILDWNFKTGEVHYSARWKALLGYEPDELEDSAALWLELSHPDDRVAADQKFIEHLEGSWPFVHTWRFAHKNGGYRWLLARAVSQRSEDTGDIERVFIVFSDISHQVLAERRLEALVAAVPDMLLRVTRDNLILDAKIPPSPSSSWSSSSSSSPSPSPSPSVSLSRLAGPDPLSGTSLDGWARSAGLSEVLLPLVVRVRATGRSETAELRSTLSPPRAYEAHVVRGADGEIVCILRDVTRRRSLEAQLQQTQRLESIGQLAAGIAHEINTPVQFVSDSVNFLKDAFLDLQSVLASHHRARDLAGPQLQTLPEDLAAALRETVALEGRSDLPYLLENIGPSIDRALEGLDRIATIVRSIKEFAHPPSAEQSLTDLNRAVTTTLTIARSEYKYVADVETQLGELPLVRCLPGEVNQAILNVIVNAAHAIAERFKGTDRRGHITIRTRRVGGEAEIAIGDDGGGIPEAIRHRIFDPFFTTKEVGRGTGQGLYLCRATIVEKHHGSLTFESEIGRGTTFFIRLPVDGAAPARALDLGADSGAHLAGPRPQAIG
jgi:PAS domain S-box-containing protein